jgi:hypothetical protein
MLDEMRTFGVYFLRGLVPWIGFTIYTAVGVMLYSFNFPSDEDDPRITEKARERVIAGCTFLKEMKPQWPMAETWVSEIVDTVCVPFLLTLCSLRQSNACKPSIVPFWDRRDQSLQTSDKRFAAP